MLTRKRIVLGGVALAIIGLLVGGYFLISYISTRLATRSVNSTLNATTTKEGLAKGDCSDDTTNKLKDINKNADAATIGKAYETQGLCLVYKKDYQAAQAAYRSGAAEFKKASLTTDAERLESAATGLDSIINLQKAQQQADEAKQDPNAAVGGS
jgi:hypothetical protein